MHTRLVLAARLFKQEKPASSCLWCQTSDLSLCLQELEAVRGGEAARLRELSAEQRELRSELEAVHSEQARQLSQARQEQLELETRLEQLRQQACACEPGARRQQEAHYAAQVRTYRGTNASRGDRFRHRKPSEGITVTRAVCILANEATVFDIVF